MTVSQGISSAVSGVRDGPRGNFNFAALQAAMEAIPKPSPMTIVTHDHLPRGKAMMMREADHLYVFMAPSDLETIPMRASDSLFLRGVPVKSMTDPDMRAVFIRGLDKLAAHEPPLDTSDRQT